MREAPLIAPGRTRMALLLQIAILAALYFAAARVSLVLLALHGLSPPLWCPAGIGLAGLLLLGVRAWPAIAVGAFFTNLDAVSASGAALIAVGNTLGAALPAWLLRRRSGGPPSLEKMGDVLRLLGYGAIAGPALSALVGLIGLRTGASHSQVADLILVFTWFIGCAAGVAVITPLLLAWAGPPPSRAAPGRWPELVGLLAGLLLASVLTSLVTPLYALLAFPLLTWAALRFGSRGATLGIVAIFGLNSLAVLAGHAPLPGTMVLSLRLFYTAVHLSYAATGLLLAASAAERHQARQVERAIEDAYRALIAASPLAIIGLDLKARVTVWSNAAEKLFGYRAEEVLGQPLPVVPAGREAEIRSLMEHGEQSLSGIETVRRHKDGRELNVLLNTWPLYDGAGRLNGTMSAHQDISERKRAQQLQEATYRISHAALTAADPGQLYAAIHRIVSELMPARNLYIALFDAATDTISFPYWMDEKDPRPDPRRARKGLTEYVIRSGRPFRDRSSSIGSLVATGEVESLGSAATDWLGVPLVVAGRPVGVLAVQSYDEGVRYSDREQAILEFVSSQVAMAIERKRAEDTLRASEEELRALFAAMRDAIFVLDREGRYRKVAPTNPELYVPIDHLVGQRLHDIFPQHQADRFLEAVVQTLDSGRPTVMEYALRLNGEEVWFTATASPVDRDTVIWVARSINEQRKAEEALRRSEDQLRQATKMEAVGRLAGGVAHDFNNLLTSVLGHADLALGRLSPGDPLYDDLLEIKSAGARAAGLTHQLLAFSRKQVLEPRVVDLNSIVSGIAKMLRRTIGEDVELVTRLAPHLGPVRADPVQMEQVLLNLAVNARDAMPEGGRLTIETMNVRLPAGPAVRMRVEDTGVGMSEEVRAHLFEPFFTTKEVGKGTGLGLATAYGIVQQSGGSIAVTSEAGRGTTFEIDLPEVMGEPAVPVPQAPRGDIRGTETVLLVEDEEAVRNLTRRVLKHNGYHVLSAPNGETALEMSRMHVGKIHLLLTDVVMPGMSGPRLAEVLLGEREGLRCIFMSGYAATALEQKVLLRRDTAFLQKPFTTEQLVRRVRETLDAREKAWGGV
jgi:PAS domain S-box-containing protein